MVASEKSGRLGQMVSNGSSALWGTKLLGFIQDLEELWGWRSQMDRQATMSPRHLSLHDICGLQEALTALSYVSLTATSEIYDYSPYFPDEKQAQGRRPAQSPTPSSRVGGIQI